MSDALSSKIVDRVTVVFLEKRELEIKLANFTSVSISFSTVKKKM
jgi:hypothetical protein